MIRSKTRAEDAYSFFKQINAILERLDLIQPFSSSDPYYEGREWEMNNQIAMCFPNLNSKERGYIFDVYFIAINVIYLKCDKALLQEKFGHEGFSKISNLLEKNHAKKKRKLERYQLRLKLSTFQEKLLDHFMDTDREEN